MTTFPPGPTLRQVMASRGLYKLRHVVEKAGIRLATLTEMCKGSCGTKDARDKLCQILDVTEQELYGCVNQSFWEHAKGGGE